MSFRVAYICSDCGSFRIRIGIESPSCDDTDERTQSNTYVPIYGVHRHSEVIYRLSAVSVLRRKVLNAEREDGLEEQFERSE